MTEEQRTKCHTIIHSHAAVATAANAGLPIPGVGIIADFATFTNMAVQLARVFGAGLTTEGAKGLAVAAVKRFALRAPMAVVGKFIPFANAIASAALIEGTGWILAEQLAARAGSYDEAEDESEDDGIGLNVDAGDEASEEEAEEQIPTLDEFIAQSDAPTEEGRAFGAFFAINSKVSELAGEHIAILKKILDVKLDDDLDEDERAEALAKLEAKQEKTKKRYDAYSALLESASARMDEIKSTR